MVTFTWVARKYISSIFISLEKADLMIIKHFMNSADVYSTGTWTLGVWPLIYGSYIEESLQFRKLATWNMKPSIIRQKGESQNGCFKKAKHAKIFEKQTFLTSVSRGKKCLFFGNFGVLCFLETPVLRFALLPYYRRNILLCCNDYKLKTFSGNDAWCQLYAYLIS